jgi:glycosyltransferase involved in cell wall biosynthesis
MSKATLLIATRNRGIQLSHALNSIRAQNYENVDIIVIDDASTDNTPEILRQHKDILDVSRIERKGGYRRNPGFVLNAGHTLARTNIVIEQGGEVCHLTDCVAPLISACRPGIVALATVYNGTAEEMRLLEKDIKEGRYEFTKDAIPETIRTSGNRWVVPRVGPHQIQLYCGQERPAPFLFLGAIHREDFEAIQGYDEKRANGNDEDLANRLLWKGVRFCFVGKAVAFHLKHGKS